MGVFHLSGLGFSPGSVTVPLTYIYLLQKAAYLKHDKKALDFFESSGEESEQFRGAPECLIFFTSREVITEKKCTATSWFDKKIENLEITKVIFKYLNKLIDQLFSENTTIKMKLKYIYYVDVNVFDYKDCFYKISITMKALHNKEVWANMIGGTNQINIAMLVAGSLFATPSVYYYVFQQNTNFLHPEIFDRFPKTLYPSDIELLLNNFQDLSIFGLASTFVIELISLFEYAQYVNKKRIEQLLDRYGYNIGNRHVPIDKAKMKRWLVQKDEAVEMSDRLKTIRDLYKKVNTEQIDNFSKWKKWGSSKKILWEQSIDDGTVTLI